MIKPDYNEWTIHVAGDFVTLCRADALVHNPKGIRVVHIHYQGYPVISKVWKSVRTLDVTPDGAALDWEGTWDCVDLDTALAVEKGVIVVGEPVTL